MSSRYQTVHSSNMSRRVQSQYSFLHLLCSTTDIQRKALLKSITHKQLVTLCEIVYNLYKRTIKISKYFVKKIVPFKSEILTLINKQANLSKKKAALIKLRSILPIILKPVFSLINNGSGTSIDGKGEIRHSDEDLSDQQEK